MRQQVEFLLYCFRPLSIDDILFTCSALLILSQTGNLATCTAISLLKISLLSYQFRTRRAGSVDRNGSGSYRKPFFCSAPLQVN